MRIAVLGTGMVGNAIGTKLVSAGHHIMMGSRTADSEAGKKWLRSVGGKAQVGTFFDAAAFGEIAFDCVNGANSLAALRSAGAKNLRGKILIPIGNPLHTPTRAALKCFWRFGCDCGPCWERHISTSGSFAMVATGKRPELPDVLKMPVRSVVLSKMTL